MALFRPDRVREAARGHLRRALDRAAGRPVLQAPAISIEFDDGYRSAHRNALPLLEARSWRSTHYLITGEPDPGMGADRDELVEGAELADLAGRADIGSHSVTHRRLAGLEPGEVEVEVRDSREALEHLIGRPVHLFAAPFGGTSPDATAEVRRRYRAQRVIGGAVNTASSFDPWSMRGLMPKQTTTEREFGDILSRTKHRRGWAVLVWHRVGEDTEGVWNTPTDQFAQQLDLIASSGIEVVPTIEMIDRLVSLTEG